MIVRAATTRGLLHQARGSGRQDAFALSRGGGSAEVSGVVAVVCDGVGQFGRSAEAALLVSRRLADLGASAVPWPQAFSLANEDLRKAAAEALAGEDADPIVDGMATTAVAVAVHRDANSWTGVVSWVGDSTLWHLGEDGKWALLTGEPEDESVIYHSTSVKPFPSADGACSSLEFSVAGGALFVMTDGVANPLRWSQDVQEALADWWSQPPDPFTFAAQVGFARKSHLDDRTVIGIWPDGRSVDGGEEG